MPPWPRCCRENRTGCRCRGSPRRVSCTAACTGTSSSSRCTGSSPPCTWTCTRPASPCSSGVRTPTCKRRTSSGSHSCTAFPPVRAACAMWYRRQRSSRCFRKHPDTDDANRWTNLKYCRPRGGGGRRQQQLLSSATAKPSCWKTSAQDDGVSTSRPHSPAGAAAFPADGRQERHYSRVSAAAAAAEGGSRWTTSPQQGGASTARRRERRPSPPRSNKGRKA